MKRMVAVTAGRLDRSKGWVRGRGNGASPPAAAFKRKVDKLLEWCRGPISTFHLYVPHPFSCVLNATKGHC